ncbi:hypothetical protein EG68_00549 [Paragonimus skrjabini miyazakii]|uniref:Anti-proliferative protein domain-containing protein n=1 Tax=Paragonimus skrjabini miyazakii TaxID=59628 RepID=A0A8S9Z8S3_9TREM|nr:hypothetical protein EG68_00549 [Paragonimus skrjabini miyazakii]
MLVEVSVAVNYILSHLYTKLPRRRVDSFGEELERCLHAKFQYNWFPNNPTRGSTFRCLSVVGPRVDLLLPEAAAVSGLDWSEIQACLPDGLVLTIDPGHVACQYQQSNYMTSDSTRNPFRSSASLSLSSSGCSSDSSSISSTNLTPNTGQVTHQVLYCVQDSWLACNRNQWSDDSSNNGVNKIIPSDTEHGDHLATAAALSVLIDAEDCTGATIGPMSAQTSKDSGQTQSLWGAEINHQGSSEPVLGFNLRDTGFNSMESCKQDYSNECEAKPINSNLPWSVPEGETENTLISMLNAEMSGFSGSTQHSSIMNENTQIFPFVNRSSSNPPQMDQPNNLCYQDLISAPNTGGDATTMLSPFQTKLDQPTEPHFGLMNGRLNSMFKPTMAALNTAATNHFVQKSLSTPSFTAATFAQTKFGSTKLKNHTKRTTNRIISPTTVQQQTFVPINGTEMTHREPALFTLLSGTQQIPATQYTDLSSFNRCTPLLIGANSNNNHNNNNTNNIVRNKNPLVSQFSFPIEDTSNNGLPYEEPAKHSLITVEKASAPSTNVKAMKCYVNSLEIQTLSHQPTPCVPTASTNALDDLFAYPIDDETGGDFLGKHNFSEAEMQTSVNSASLWPACPMPLNRQSHEGLSRDFYATTDWKQTSSLGPTNGPKQPYANICANGPLKTEDITSLHDDSILSNRMVNLLLEEDNSNEGLVQDSERVKGSVLLRESSTTEGFGDNGQQNVHQTADGIASYITDLDNLRTIGKEARSNTGQ